MNLSGIALYCFRAGAFAAAVCGGCALICRLRGKNIRRRRMLGIAYIAALFQITVLRGGVDWANVMLPDRSAQLTPLQTMRGLLAGGIWNLCYNVVGNLIWFVPLGMLLGRRKLAVATLLGAGVSAGIELMQYLLKTGVTDVDDIILNALGAAIGWGIAHVYIRINKE